MEISNEFITLILIVKLLSTKHLKIRLYENFVFNINIIINEIFNINVNRKTVKDKKF